MKNQEYDYSIVMEQTSEPTKPTIIDDGSKSGLDFLRFDACLQAFYKPLNRNRRGWKAEQIRAMEQSSPIQELLKRKSLFGEAGRKVLWLSDLCGQWVFPIL